MFDGRELHKFICALERAQQEDHIAELLNIK